ncbi:cytochrome c oxidase subunit 8A, mitochondrial [Puntigrus tetrazona]|uniref:cytochrome c oxidase subunit 8A, mitochondrial n=1 Tax=Puntigrus tetrazona TaxID=1606681 RepID=UPI001C896E85|nr:cytochrome c oxidase subunit 8A, mitochondrial [Puntigrus tetrazona]
MSGLLRGIARVRAAPVLRGSAITQRANIATRPAKDKFGPVETAIGLTVFSLTILGPSGYILANLESYKKKEADE